MSSGIIELASQGNISKVIRDMRVRSLLSPYYFAKVVLGYRLLTDYLHMRDMHLWRDRCAAGIKKQLIEWSRAFYKTTCFTITGSMWFVLPVNDEDHEYAINELGLDENEWFKIANLHDQDDTQLLAFETESNARKKVEAIKEHFENNEMFRLVFPEIAYTGKEYPWTSKCLRIRRVGWGKSEPEGTFEAIGVGGALQSRHYKRVFEDDLVGENAIKSPDKVMLDTIGWHGRLLGAFVDATRQERHVISNRWGFNDLNYYIRTHEADEYFIHGRSAIEIDETTGEEYAVFPVKGDGTTAYTLEALEKIKNSGTISYFDFACQYMNQPTLPGEQEVNLKALHTYTVSDEGQILCSCGEKFFPSQLNRYTHYDPYNAKGAASKSRPAVLTVGLSVSKHIVLLDYYCTRENYAGVYENGIFRQNDLWRPKCLSYEDVGHQNMTEFHIKEQQKHSEFTKKHKLVKRIVAVGHKGKDNETRIRDYLMPFISDATYKLTIRSKHSLFKSQLETFPNPTLDHDYDLLTAMAQGPTLSEDGSRIWVFPVSEEDMKSTRLEEEAYMKKLAETYTNVEVLSQ